MTTQGRGSGGGRRSPGGVICVLACGVTWGCHVIADNYSTDGEVSYRGHWDEETRTRMNHIERVTEGSVRHSTGKDYESYTDTHRELSGTVFVIEKCRGQHGFMDSVWKWSPSGWYSLSGRWNSFAERPEGMKTITSMIKGSVSPNFECLTRRGKGRY